MEEQEATLNDNSFMDSSPMSEAELGVADPSAETQNTETAEDPGTKQVEAEETKETTKEEPKEDRFDQHPRFKELIEEKNTLKKQLQELAAKVDGQNKPEGRDFEKELSDLEAKLEEGDLDLAAFTKAQRKIMAEQGEADRQRLLSEIKQQGQMQKSQEAFLKDHPYINEVLSTAYDKVESLKRANPLHDDVSAAMAVKIAELESTRESAIKEAVEKAKKETEAQVIKNFQAKQSARSLGSGARPAPDDSDMLKDTSKHGGVHNALVSRLKAMRSK